MVVRASNYSWPMVGGSKREVQLQWVAADPLAIDPTPRLATAWAGSDVSGGRVYNLVFNRTYGPEGGSMPTAAELSSPGDVIAWPLLRIYGPIALPLVRFDYGAGVPAGAVRFVPPFNIDTGRFLEVSTANNTADWDGDPGRPALASLDWLATVWPYVPARGQVATMTLDGDSTTGTSQVQASWLDRFIS